MPGNGRKSRDFSQQAGVKGGVPASREKGVQVGTYPESKDIKTPKSKKNFPKMRCADGQVYLFIRFRQEYLTRLKNACTRVKRIVQNHGGTFIGIAHEVQLLEGDLYKGMPATSILIIRFESLRDCIHWERSDIIFKQKDFPTPADEVEMFAVPLQYLPEEECKMKAFHLTEMFGMMVDSDIFKERYANPVAKQMDKCEIYHGIVASKDVTRIRNCMIRPDTFILLNCAETPEKLKAFYDSQDYTGYKNHRQSTFFAENDSCMFCLDPVMS